MDTFISISELARLSGVSRQTLDRWRLLGRISPAAVVSGREVFDSNTLQTAARLKAEWRAKHQPEITNDQPSKD